MRKQSHLHAHSELRSRYWDRGTQLRTIMPYGDSEYIRGGIIDDNEASMVYLESICSIVGSNVHDHDHDLEQLHDYDEDRVTAIGTTSSNLDSICSKFSGVDNIDRSVHDISDNGNCDSKDNNNDNTNDDENKDEITVIGALSLETKSNNNDDDDGDDNNGSGNKFSHVLAKAVKFSNSRSNKRNVDNKHNYRNENKDTNTNDKKIKSILKTQMKTKSTNDKNIDITDKSLNGNVKQQQNQSRISKVFSGIGARTNPGTEITKLRGMVLMIMISMLIKNKIKEQTKSNPN